jgi:hypothetical protein
METRKADTLRPIADRFDGLDIPELLELVSYFVVVDRLARWRTSEGDLEAALELLLGHISLFGSAK